MVKFIHLAFYEKGACTARCSSGEPVIPRLQIMHILAGGDFHLAHIIIPCLPHYSAPPSRLSRIMHFSTRAKTRAAPSTSHHGLTDRLVHSHQAALAMNMNSAALSGQMVTWRKKERSCPSYFGTLPNKFLFSSTVFFLLPPRVWRAATKDRLKSSLFLYLPRWSYLV